MTRAVATAAEWKRIRAGLAGRSIGFVPTMGALHAGHRSLIQRSRNENDVTVASIFVNPTQFNDPDDLRRYPRTYEKDLALLNEAGADYLFHPDEKELYPDGYHYRITEVEFSKILCGAHRPGHFDGVLTVVMKLLQIIAPHRAYFGEKDYQQYLLVKGMAETFFLDAAIVPCPIVREADGLAMSSRNALLTPDERARAAAFPRILKAAATPAEAARDLAREGFRVDYVEDRDGRRFGAVFLGRVRLIDNVPRKGERP